MKKVSNIFINNKQGYTLLIQQTGAVVEETLRLNRSQMVEYRNRGFEHYTPKVVFSAILLLELSVFEKTFNDE